MCLNQNKLLCKNNILFLFQLDSYEVQMKFDIISYASEPKEIVSITSMESHDMHYILKKLNEFSYQSMFVVKMFVFKILNHVHYYLYCSFLTPVSWILYFISGHGNKKGTNLYKALERVYSQLVFLRETKRNQFNETQNVIIIATDGKTDQYIHI